MFNKTKSKMFTIPEIKVNKKVTNKSAYQHENEDNKKPDNQPRKNLNISSGNLDITNLTTIEVDYLNQLKSMKKNTSKSKILSQIKSMSESSLKISKEKLIKLLDTL